MIPKKIHYCWFGYGKKPKRLQNCIASWKRLCPDYELIEWNESNYDVGKSLYTKLAYEKQKWAHVSDYARIDIVNRYGGIYFDTDVELLKKPDPLLKNQMFFALEQESRKINSGLGFGSRSHHMLLERLLLSYDELAEQIAAGRAEFLACTVYETRLLIPYGFRQKDICQRLAGGIRVYSSEYFCPKKVTGGMSRKKLTEKTYSIHHYEASWIKEHKWYKVKVRFSKELAFIKNIIIQIAGEDNFKRWRGAERWKEPQGADQRSVEQKNAETKSREISLAVLTPAYNRAGRLLALYESLKRQSDQSFRWVLCDDGSKDDTKKLAESWQREPNGFVVDYYWKENEGKHSAVNYAVKHIDEDYVMIVDSDDYLTDDAVRYVRRWLLEVDEDAGFAGVAGLRGYSTKERIGRFPKHRQTIDATNLERRRLQLTGDKAEVYRTRLLKKYPFPVFKDEKFLAETAVWNLIAAEGKKLRWHNKIIYITQYLKDGLTNDRNKEADSFRGYTYHQRMNFLLKSFPENIFELARYIKTAHKKGMSDLEIKKRMHAGRFEYLAACLAGRTAAVRGGADLMDRDIKVIAYYLPQFHEVEENSRWWGEGFTDWTSVKEAQQLFEGHKQPRMPYGGNYYNLLDKGTMAWQAELSKKAGVDGFCFYHYWFHGKKILEKPVENYLKWKDLKQNYCLSWANDSWIRSWSNIDGNDWCPLQDRKYGRDGREILLEQDYGDEATWTEHFNDLLPFFKDKRYLRYDGKPVFLICRGELIPRLGHMLALWQKLAHKNGLPGLYIILSNSTKKLLKQSKADGMVMYEPGYTLVHDLKLWCALKHRRQGGLAKYDYGLFWKSILCRPVRNAHIYQGGFVNYDDTPRRGASGLCIDGYSNEKFTRYLGRLVKKSRKRGSRFVFLTAWNEWGEGAYLEPDTVNGYGYLKAVRKAVDGKEKQGNDSKDCD